MSLPLTFTLFCTLITKKQVEHVLEFLKSSDALAIGELVRSGATDAETMLEQCWKAIDALNPSINAVTADMREIALSDIRHGLPTGPFTGVPILLKDEYLFTDGFPCGFASELGKGTAQPADHTSTLIARYRAAGLVLAGKTNLPEFGASVTTEPKATGITRNPWNLDHTVGGSSGGSSAAVAAGIVPVAYANDGAGSIRIPASCCGVFGLKPTRGRVPTGPVDGEYWNGLVIQHAVSRTVRDSAALLDVSQGWEEGSLYAAPAVDRPYLEEVGRDPGRLRIGLSVDAPTGVVVDPECARAVEQAAALLEELGHEVVPAAPDHDGSAMTAGIADLLSLHLANGIKELSQHHGRTAGADNVEAAHLELARRGRDMPALRFLEILDLFGATARRAAPFYQDFDLWLTPSLATPPPRHGHISTNDPDADCYVERYFGFIPFTPLANVTGCPAMSVPLYQSSTNLPIGIHFMAAFGREDLLFRVASQLEDALPWQDRHPTHSIWNLETFP